jgi:hypothetical protein
VLIVKLISAFSIFSFSSVPFFFWIVTYLI